MKLGFLEMFIKPSQRSLLGLLTIDFDHKAIIGRRLYLRKCKYTTVYGDGAQIRIEDGGNAQNVHFAKNASGVNFYDNSNSPRENAQITTASGRPMTILHPGESIRRTIDGVPTTITYEGKQNS